MGVESILEIPANDTFKSDKLRSDSPIVLPSVCDKPADCPEVLGYYCVWKITVFWLWVSEP